MLGKCAKIPKSKADKLALIWDQLLRDSMKWEDQMEQVLGDPDVPELVVEAGGRKWRLGRAGKR